MESLSDEIGLTDNLIAFWNLDTALPSYPDSTSSSYQNFSTQAVWQGSQVSAFNSTIDTTTIPNSIIIDAPSVGGNSGININLSTPVPTGTTLLQIYANGTTNTLYVEAISTDGTSASMIGTFGGNGTPQDQYFNVEIGSFPINILKIYINANDYTSSSNPTGSDTFTIHYINLLTDTIYFNNVFGTTDGWSNTTASGGNLIQTNTTISHTFTPNLLGIRFRARIRTISGTNPIVSINGINKVITTDGTYSIIDVILPSTTTVSISCAGNTLGYSFIYIGLGSYATYEQDCLNGILQQLYPVGAYSVGGVSGNALSFYNAYAYTPFVFSLSAPISFSFLININELPTNEATVGATLVGSVNSYPSVGINYLGNIVFSFIDNSGNLQNLVGKRVLAPNVWHYIVATHSGTTATIYTDGVPDPSFTSTLQSFNNNISMGAFDTVNTNPYDGVIDDVRVFATTLLADDILTQYQFYTSIIPAITINYATTIMNDLFISYYCNDILPDPPDGTRAFYMDTFTIPYNLSNTPMLNTTVKTNNTSSILFSSVNNRTVGFTVATSITTGNNYFRINVKNNDKSSLNRNLYISFYNGTTLLSTATLLSTNSFSTLEYIHSFASTITSIQVYMNDAQPAYGFEVAWIYMGNGIDKTNLIDYSGNNNNGLITDVFSDAITGIDFSGHSSVATPSTSFLGDFSISMWINPNILDNEILLSKLEPSGYTVLPLSVNLTTAGNINLVYAKSNSTTNTISTTNNPIISGASNYIVITYASHVYSIFVNGNQLINNADIYSDALSPISFGTSLIGSLNKIRTYTRALSVGEIKYLYTNNL
jgi:hypothetical protein